MYYMWYSMDCNLIFAKSRNVIKKESKFTIKRRNHIYTTIVSSPFWYLLVCCSPQFDSHSLLCSYILQYGRVGLTV